MSKEYKLDIFKTLRAVDRHDYDFLSTRTEEEQRGFVPIVVLRWASGQGNSEEGRIGLLLLNRYANVNFFDIEKHPDLQFRLLCAASMNQTIGHQWIPAAKGKKSIHKIYKFLDDYYPNQSADELNIILGKHTAKSFKDFVLGCGLNDKETEEVIRHFNDYKKTKKA